MAMTEEAYDARHRWLQTPEAARLLAAASENGMVVLCVGLSQHDEVCAHYRLPPEPHTVREGDDGMRMRDQTR